MAKKESKRTVGMVIKSHLKFLVITFSVALVLVGLLIAGVWYGLRVYTQHGIEREVPNVCGMYVEEASTILGASNLRLEVIDSTYSGAAPLGTIIEQNPAEFSHVKNGRAVYVIVNAKTKRQVPLPSVIDLSARQATSSLRSVGLEVGEVLYEPGDHRNLVIDVRLADTSVVAGTRLDEGTMLDLIVAQGVGNEMVQVPNLLGKTLQESRSILFEARLAMGGFSYDPEDAHPEQTDSTFVVFAQEPSPGKREREGTPVVIRLSNDPERALMSGTEADEDELF
ncbi:MAG: PASTA domain-containing protein [Paludibacteraceae bacterium]|nr:PASTA domain-containing protein [Paludibacteraceae bacterium]